MKTQSWYESCLVLVVSVFIARVQTIPERRVWAKSGHPEKPRRATGAQGDPGRAKSLRYEVMPAPRGAVAELGPADQEQKHGGAAHAAEPRLGLAGSTLRSCISAGLAPSTGVRTQQPLTGLCVRCRPHRECATGSSVKVKHFPV